MKKVFPFLYLVVATLGVFYFPKIYSGLVEGGGETPKSLAEEARMDENAYFSLREVASVQLGLILISYDLDEESGGYQVRYSNAACPNLQVDPQQLAVAQKNQQEKLHRRILMLGPAADEDGSGFVSNEEGARFRDLFAQEHLADHCLGEGNP